MKTIAACGGLKHIFEKPWPESPTFLESLSPWTQIESMKTVHLSSFTGLFSEFHLKEDNVQHDSPESSTSFSSYPPSSPSSSFSSNSMFSGDLNPSLSAFDILRNDDNGGSSINQETNGSRFTSNHYSYGQKKQHRHSDSFSSVSSETLPMCTEELGFESCDDIEDLLRLDVCNNDWQSPEERTRSFTRKARAEDENHCGGSKTSATCLGSFPPPISCIGRSGKPWVCYESFREDGRFILKERRIPTQEWLHSCRENGRFRLQFIMSDDEILEEDDEEKNEDTGKDDGDRSSTEMEGKEYVKEKEEKM